MREISVNMQIRPSENNIIQYTDYIQKTYIHVHIIIKQNRPNNGTIRNFKTSNVIKLMCWLSFGEWQHTRIEGSS